MFGKRRPPDSNKRPEVPEAARSANETSPPEARPRGRADAPAQPNRPATPGASDMSRRVTEYLVPGARRHDPRNPLPGAASEGRKLVVGREISLSGEIKACEKLIVDGRVEADLKDCKILAISDTGLFKGSAVVEEADISGRFEGELRVEKRLVLRVTGRIAAAVSYTELEIERGGKITGTMEEILPPAPAQPAAAEASPAEDKAAKPAPEAAGRPEPAKAAERTNA